MLRIDRLNAIETKILQNGSVVVSKLSKELNVTEETIRRDLAELEELGKLIRVRGGAYLPDAGEKVVPIDIRENLLLKEKDIISQYAFNFIHEWDTIFLDSSTTAIQLANLIKVANIRLTIITNSLSISNLFLNHKSVRLICLGGQLRSTTNSFVGQLTLDYTENFSADSCFISSTGIELGIGLTDNNEKEAFLRKKIMDQSKKTFLITDHTKFSESAPYIITSLDKVDTIITDRALSQDWIDYCFKSKTKIIIANMD